TGESLAVSVVQATDPADDVVQAGGASVPAGHRAVLLHTVVANTGPAYYAAPGDAHLVVETADRTLLGQSGIVLPGRDPFGNGIPPQQTANGWTLFFVPNVATLTGIKWCISPQHPQTIIGWPFEQSE